MSAVCCGVQMLHHEDVECALKVVSCFFEPLGCDHRVNNLLRDSHHIMLPSFYSKTHYAFTPSVCRLSVHRVWESVRTYGKLLRVN